jgi:hypothetical protein
MMNEMKICPFCGLVDDHADNCYFTLKAAGAMRGELEAAWNRRVNAGSIGLATPAPAKRFFGSADKTALQVIDEYLHPRIPTDLRHVGHFIFDGVAYVATSSEDPRGVPLYGSPSEAQAIREAYQKNRPDPCTACGGAALMGGSECPMCDGTGRSFR